VKKHLQILALFLVVSRAACAQLAVTATVADPNGNPYAKGTASAQSVAASGQATYYTSPVTTSNTGFFSLTLPVAASWVFTVCAPPSQLGPTANPTPKQVCFSSQPISISISGDISSSITVGVSVPVLGPAPSGGATVVSYPNSFNGTSCNGLAKLDTAIGASTLGRATSTTGGETSILGIVESNCGTSGNAVIAVNGLLQTVFDTSSITVGDGVGVSGSVTGAATDLGSLPVTSGAYVIGTIVLSPSGGLPTSCTLQPGCYIQLQLGGSGSGGGNSANAVVTNPGATQTVTPTSATATPINQVCNSSAASSQPCGQITNSSGNPVIQGLNNGQANIGYGTTHNWGSGVSSNSDLNGELTASSNTASYSFTGTYTSHPICTASDETSRNAVQVTYTGTTSVTFTTSGSADVVSYQCTFRN
jgi:hypothetical protein